MKRVWKKSWRCASALALLSVMATPALSRAPQEKPPRRANELTLAGLRPGKDKMPSASKTLGGIKGEILRDDAEAVHWRDGCNGRELRVERDENHVIQSLTVSKTPAVRDCTDKPTSGRADDAWKTGRGLAIGDKCARVVELYGKPNSRGPSVKGDVELELLYYAFDWAGSEVPQVMEVDCERRTGQVVEITLASPSL